MTLVGEECLAQDVQPIRLEGTLQSTIKIALARSAIVSSLIILFTTSFFLLPGTGLRAQTVRRPTDKAAQQAGGNANHAEAQTNQSI